MKLKILFMITILVILSVTPMIFMGKFDPMAFFDSGISKGVSELSKLKAKVPKSLPGVMAEEKVQVYKWRNENGVMQFSNTPPAGGAPSVKMEIQPNKNLIQAVKVPPKKEKSKSVAQSESPNPYSVKGMKKVMDDAKGIEELLRKRQENQQKMMNNL